MTEIEKNKKAEEVISRIIESCQWINIHTLNAETSIYILELRD